MTFYYQPEPLSTFLSWWEGITSDAPALPPETTKVDGPEREAFKEYWRAILHILADQTPCRLERGTARAPLNWISSAATNQHGIPGFTYCSTWDWYVLRTRFVRMFTTLDRAGYWARMLETEDGALSVHVWGEDRAAIERQRAVAHIDRHTRARARALSAPAPLNINIDDIEL